MGHRQEWRRWRLEACSMGGREFGRRPTITKRASGGQLSSGHDRPGGRPTCGEGGIPNSIKHRRQDRRRYQLVLTELEHVQTPGPAISRLRPARRPVPRGAAMEPAGFLQRVIIVKMASTAAETALRLAVHAAAA